MLGRVKSLLANVQLYVALQRGLGADRLRYRCIDELKLQPGDRVLDIGCGPAYYFPRLPAVRYFGFDTSQPYIDYARRQFGSDRAEFHCAVFTERYLDRLPPVDAVLLLGLLHHLSDEDSRALLALTAKVLAPRGRIISVDTCFEPSQGWVSRWMSKNDRGEFVREPAGFTALAREAFAHVDGEVLSGVTRIPSSFWMMRMTSPKPAPASALPAARQA